MYLSVGLVVSVWIVSTGLVTARACERCCVPNVVHYAGCFKNCWTKCYQQPVVLLSCDFSTQTLEQCGMVQHENDSYDGEAYWPLSPDGYVYIFDAYDEAFEIGMDTPMISVPDGTSDVCFILDYWGTFEMELYIKQFSSDNTELDYERLDILDDRLNKTARLDFQLNDGDKFAFIASNDGPAANSPDELSVMRVYRFKVIKGKCTTK